MVSPEEIRDKSGKRYLKVLSALLKGDDLPLEFKVDKSYLGLTSENFRQSIRQLLQESAIKKKHSYTVDLKETNTKQFGMQSVPIRIYFKSVENFVGFLGKETEFNEFQSNATLLTNEFPLLKSWVEANPRKIILYSKEWKNLILVLKYLTTDHKRDTFYIRELPINVHTKYIEELQSIVEELYSTLQPQKYAKDESSFHKRMGFKEASQLVRARYLDAGQYLNSTFSDISLPIPDFAQLKADADKIFIVENLTNFLAFPMIQNSMIIWGKGFEVEKLKSVFWLRGKAIYYWGDMDTDGLAILSQLRAYLPDMSSIFMEFKDVIKYEGNKVFFEDRKRRNLNGLNDTELQAYQYLFEKGIRIEQEKIPQADLIEKLKYLGLINQ